MKNDLIVWFDNKTGEKIKTTDYVNLINELREVAQKYGFDFYMSSNPKGMKRNLSKIKDII